MNCNNCGNQVENGQQVCNNCGNNLNQPNLNPQYQNNPMPVQPKKKNGLVIALIVLAVFLLISFGVRFVLLNKTNDFINNLNKEIEDALKDMEENDLNVDGEKNADTDKQKVGSDEHGYVYIPKDWNKFIDVDLDPSSNVIQYSLANTYILTMSSVEKNDSTAKERASNLAASLKEENEITDLTGATVSIASYTAYQVYGYYPNEKIWLVSWIFETEDGKIHFLSVEGPDQKSEHFNIPKTFTLKK